MKLLLKLSYDGSAYCGFQFQPSCPTVQGTLTERLSEMFGFPCLVTGCSRTDAGVHALGYVASVEPADRSRRVGEWWKIPCSRIHRAAARYLPDDISIMGAAAVEDDFHPRYRTVSKEYVYVIADSVARDPFLRGRAFVMGRQIDDGGIELMNKAAQNLVGRHDFSSFMAAGSSVSDTVRTLFSLRAKRVSNGIVTVSARGDGFLYNMVRILAGTLVDTAFGRFDPSDLKRILDSHDRREAGTTAPACGLYLKEIFYPEEIHFAAE